MIDTYFKFELISEFWIPAIITAIIVAPYLIILIKIIISNYKANKIRDYMKKQGYKRELLRVTSIGEREWYGYKVDNYYIEEEKLFRMPYKEVKKQFK